MGQPNLGADVGKLFLPFCRRTKAVVGADDGEGMIWVLFKLGKVL